jgi:hypothetical protein
VTCKPARSRLPYNLLWVNFPERLADVLKNLLVRLVFVLTILIWSNSARAQLFIKPPAVQSVEAGGVAIVLFSLKNTTTNNVNLEFELKIPKWISTLSSLQNRVLAAGAEVLMPVTLALESDAPAGVSTLTLIARDRGRNPFEVRANVSLEVQESRGLKLIASEVFSGGRLGLMLVNLGNTPETVGVSFTLAQPNKVAPNGFEAVTLNPNESKLYSADLSVFSNGYLVIQARAVSGTSTSFLMRLKPGADSPAAPFGLRGQLTINGFSPFGAGLNLTGLLSDYLELQLQANVSNANSSQVSATANLELRGLTGVAGFARNWRGWNLKLGTLNDDFLDTGFRADGWGLGAIVAPFDAGLIVGGTFAGSGTALGLGYRFSSGSALMLGSSFNSAGTAFSLSFVSSDNPAIFARVMSGANQGLSLDLSAGWSTPENALNAELVFDASSLNLKFSYETLLGLGRLKAEASYNRSQTPNNNASDRLNYSVQYRSDLQFDLVGTLGNSAVLGAGWFGHLPDWNFGARASLDLYGFVPSLELSLAGRLFTGFSINFSTLFSSRELGFTFGLALKLENLTANLKGVYQNSNGIAAFGGSLALEYNLEALSFRLKAAVSNDQSSLALEAIYRFDLPIPEGITALAGGRREALVSGRAFLDLNANGIDDVEPALVGFAVAIGESESLTDQNGRYTIRVSLPNEKAKLSLVFQENKNQSPDAPSIVSLSQNLELQAGSRLELNLAILPAASLRLQALFQAQDNSLQDAPSLQGISVLLESATKTANSQAIISSDATGNGLAKGLPPGQYKLRIIAQPAGVLAVLESDTIELFAGIEGQINVILKLPEVENTSNNLSPRIELETNDPLPPGAEPNLRVSIDGDADTVTLVYPDGTQQNLETVGPENFVTKILIPTFSNASIPALYTVLVRVTRGQDMVEREINIPIDASVPLCSLQFEPVVVKPGEKVKVNLRCLFRPEQANLYTNGFGLGLIADRLFPYQFSNEFLVPSTWTGRVTLTVQTKSKRLSAQFSSVLVVR